MLKLIQFFSELIHYKLFLKIFLAQILWLVLRLLFARLIWK